MLHKRLTILSDNRTKDPERFQTEHGLAVLYEAGDYTLLLDTGASDLLIRNAQELDIDLGDVDVVFLSHGHSDHIGGLEAFLNHNYVARIIVSPDAINSEFFSQRSHLHSITTSWPEDARPGRTQFITQSQKLLARTNKSFEEGGGIYVIADIPHKHPQPEANRHLFIKTGDDQYRPDDFRHELALYADGLLYTGCAHNGLENILEACPWPVHTVIGGFHLLDAHLSEHYERPEVITALAQRLAKRYPQTTFYTSHCTGDGVFQTMKGVMGDQLQPFYCGQQINL